MPEIKCPNCGKVFEVDESKYAALIADIRNKEFNEELKEKLHSELELEKERSNAKISSLNNQISSLKLQNELEIKRAIEEKNEELYTLKSMVESLNKELKEKDASYQEKIKNEIEVLNIKKEKISNILIEKFNVCQNHFFESIPSSVKTHFEKVLVDSQKSGGFGVIHFLQIN